MAKESILTPEARAMIGREAAPVSEEVSKSAIRRFARATFDSNPLHTDEAQAAKGPHGGLVAPPAFFMALAKPIEEETPPLHPPLKASRTVAGGEEWELFAPIRPGDVITRRSKLVDMYEKQGRSGPMVFRVTETTYTNQRGELVAKTRSTSIAY